MITTRKCLSFAYQAIDTEPDAGVEDTPVISAFVVNMEQEIAVLATRRVSNVGWNFINVIMPEGVHQIVIEGKRGTGNEATGLVVDDIHIEDCEHKGTHHCYTMITP